MENKENEITKALQDLADMVKNNESLDKIRIIIDLKPPKPSKATKESK